MDTQIWPTITTLHRDDYKTKKEYTRAFREYTQHYGYYHKVDGGWMFFEFLSDYETWKRQK